MRCLQFIDEAVGGQRVHVTAWAAVVHRIDEVAVVVLLDEVDAELADESVYLAEDVGGGARIRKV
jgi:hypothetical protein